jgi:hypothetical protein
MTAPEYYAETLGLPNIRPGEFLKSGPTKRLTD